MSRGVETSKGDLPFSDRGGLSIRNWLDALANICDFAFALLRQSPRLVHIGSAPGPSFAKHGLMALIARLLGRLVVLQMHCSVGSLIPLRRTLWQGFVMFVLSAGRWHSHTIARMGCPPSVFALGADSICAQTRLTQVAMAICRDPALLEKNTCSSCTWAISDTKRDASI